MIRARSAWLLAALLCTALLAGCGSSSSSTTTTSSSTPAASTQTTSTASTATTSTSTTPSTAAPTGSVAQLAATVCKSTAYRSHLPANLKVKVEEICSAAASGNQAKAEEIARKVCVEAIDSIPGPNSAAKEKALKECSAKH
jgi:hypothetical protein